MRLAFINEWMKDVKKKKKNGNEQFNDFINILLILRKDSGVICVSKGIKW